MGTYPVVFGMFIFINIVCIVWLLFLFKFILVCLMIYFSFGTCQLVFSVWQIMVVGLLNMML